MFRHIVTLVLSVSVSTQLLSGSIAADELPQSWQVKRDAGNVLTDEACDGDKAAISRVWREVEEGNPVLLNNMNWLRRNCAPFTSVGVKEAMKFMRQAAESGYPIALKNYGWMMLRGGGNGVPNDPEGGAAMLEQAARGGYGTAAVELGSAYADGFRLPRDMEKAAEMLRVAEREGVESSDLSVLRDKVRRVANQEKEKGNDVPTGLTEERHFAALAVSITDGGYGYAHDYPDPARARERAERECVERGGQDCQIKLMGVGKGCLAYHYAGGSATAAGWAMGTSLSAVQNRAAEECRKRNGSTCSGSAWVCNDRTEAALDVLIELPMPKTTETASQDVAKAVLGGCYLTLRQFCSNFTGAFDGEDVDIMVDSYPEGSISIENCGEDTANQVNLSPNGEWSGGEYASSDISKAALADIRAAMEHFRSEVLATYPRCESKGTRAFLGTVPASSKKKAYVKELSRQPNPPRLWIDFELL